MLREQEGAAPEVVLGGAEAERGAADAGSGGLDALQRTASGLGNKRWVTWLQQAGL